MYFSSSLVVLSALLATSALAAPTQAAAPVEKRSFKVERVANPKFVRHDGTRQLIKSYAKWGMTIPEELKNYRRQEAASENVTAVAAPLGNVTAAANGTQTGLVTATPEQGDVEYLSPVDIGGQVVNLDFDSGSSDLWVFSTNQPAAQTKGHVLYDQSKSSTFKMLEGSKYSISYGDGSGSAGIVGTDRVTIGGAVVENQAIEMATAVSGSFIQDTASQGLVGLAYSKLNTVKPVKQKTFFDNLMPSLAEKVFTADLRANATGAYEFGRIDQTKFTGELAFTPVNTTNGFWQFESQKFSVDGVEMTLKGGTAIADTGTTLMLANPAIVNAYYSKVKGATNNAQVGGVIFPCTAKMPDLAIAMGPTYMAVVPGKFINFAAVDAANTMCFGGLQATTSSLQIYGDILFKAQFVVFNGGDNTIGMAPHA